jgi:hypothetical protein
MAVKLNGGAGAGMDTPPPPFLPPVLIFWASFIPSRLLLIVAWSLVISTHRLPVVPPAPVFFIWFMGAVSLKAAVAPAMPTRLLSVLPFFNSGFSRPYPIINMWRHDITEIRCFAVADKQHVTTATVMHRTVVEIVGGSVDKLADWPSIIT